MSDPDIFLNYTPTSAVSDVGKQAQLGGTAGYAFPDSVHIPEGVHKAIEHVDSESANLLLMTCVPLPAWQAGLSTLQKVMMIVAACPGMHTTLLC